MPSARPAAATILSAATRMTGGCRWIISSPQHIVPGHDPLVMRRYPPPKPKLEGRVVRLDAMPRG
jgi:hypothetical protein